MIQWVGNIPRAVDAWCQRGQEVEHVRFLSEGDGVIELRGLDRPIGQRHIASYHTADRRPLVEHYWRVMRAVAHGEQVWVADPAGGHSPVHYRPYCRTVEAFYVWRSLELRVRLEDRGSYVHEETLDEDGVAYDIVDIDDPLDLAVLRQVIDALMLGEMITVEDAYGWGTLHYIPRPTLSLN